jgi:hypothetical protein
LHGVNQNSPTLQGVRTHLMNLKSKNLFIYEIEVVVISVGVVINSKSVCGSWYENEVCYLYQHGNQCD